MDEPEEKDFDPLAPSKDDLKDDLAEDDDIIDPLIVPGVLPAIKPVVKEDEDVDDIDAIAEEEDEGVNDFGAEDYNAPDND